jgi:hypothetical protein
MGYYEQVGSRLWFAFSNGLWYSRCLTFVFATRRFSCEVDEVPQDCVQ